MRISVVGLGYVGLVTAACLAKWGHAVRGVDTSAARVTALNAGSLPIFEPGLDELVAAGRDAGRLTFGQSIPDAVRDAEMVFIAVGTHDGNGGWQTDTMRTCLAGVVPEMPDGSVLVVRSTLPPGFVSELAPIVSRIREEVDRPPVRVLLNPEFTREGRAITDFLRPERVVIGVLDDPEEEGAARLHDLYTPAEAPILVMSGINAALAKLGANLFLATKISFANELAGICEGFGASIDDVVEAMGYDSRIGRSFLRAGVGFGGSCLPNQVSMMIRSAEGVGVEASMLRAVDKVNHGQRTRLADTLTRLLGEPLAGKRVALLGLTFKPDTDDLRDAPALEVARLLLERGVAVTATDPMATARSRVGQMFSTLRLTDSAYDAVGGADAIALLTEWPEYATLDWTAVRALARGRIVVDGRNYLSAQEVSDAGFLYVGVGRGHAVPPSETSAELPASEVAENEPRERRVGVEVTL